MLLFTVGFLAGAVVAVWFVTRDEPAPLYNGVDMTRPIGPGNEPQVHRSIMGPKV
jgi:hypothetical protein